MATTLTSYLASLSTPVPYEEAITHPIYAAQAYPRFIALLITKVPLDSTDPSVQDRSRRTLQVLVGCLDNIVREVNFFEDTARKYDLDIGGVKQGEGQVWLERKATRDYTAEMARVASLSTLEDGLVFLWAMEKVYLDAWSNVSSVLCTKPDSELGKTGEALRDLSYSWSIGNSDFSKFVDGIGILVDEYLTPLFQEVSKDRGSKHGEVIVRAERIWARVVELEAEFWPELKEEERMRIPQV
ncbi:heme oxygenase-like protein [Pisolithus marmoratus]|nr:heme oxygenase-like protein [Pisolithus marmoratus]